MWLLKGLVPDHNTIANYRKDNPKSIAKVFRSTVQLAKHFNLIWGRLIAGETLTTNGRWYNKARGKTINRVKHYKTKACITCLLFEKCTQNKAGRLIERSEHMDLIDANKQRMAQNLDVYRKKTGHCGASIRHYEKAMGLLLHYDQKNHGTRLGRCGIDIHLL